MRFANAWPTRPLAVALCLGIVACSDRNGASEANFRKILQPVVEDVFCRPLTTARLVPEDGRDEDAFPFVVSREVSSYEGVSRAPVLAMLDEAARAGLLARTESETSARPWGTEEAAARRRTISYAPTERGRPFFRSLEQKTSGGDSRVLPAACGATGEIVDVVRWTEPADLFGRRVSQVTYRYRGVDPIPIGSVADRAKIAEPRERMVVMELASDGWRVMPR